MDPEVRVFRTPGRRDEATLRFSRQLLLICGQRFFRFLVQGFGEVSSSCDSVCTLRSPSAALSPHYLARVISPLHKVQGDLQIEDRCATISLPFGTSRLTTDTLPFYRFARSVSSAIRPVLPILSLLDTCCCIGSPLALNAGALRSPFGLIILLPVLAFHTVAFVGGYYSAVGAFGRIEDRRNVARTMSFEVGKSNCELRLDVPPFEPEKRRTLQQATTIR